MNKIILVDIDGVLANNVYSIIRLAYKLFDVQITAKDVATFEMNDVLDADQVQAIITHPDFVLGAIPNESASAFMMTLQSYNWKSHIVTSRPEFQRTLTVSWLDQFNIHYRTLAMGVSDKADYARTHGIEFSVEDKYQNAVDLAGIVTVSYLFTPPDCLYNQGELKPKMKRVTSFYEIWDDLRLV